MPLNLDTPTVISETITTIELTSVTFDIESREIHIAYDEGFDSGGFQRSIKDKILTVPSDQIATFLTVWENANGNNKFAEMRIAALRAIAALGGRPGTVSGEV